jgi:hypothetical protein
MPCVKVSIGVVNITCPAVSPVEYAFEVKNPVLNNCVKLLLIFAKAVRNGSPSPSLGCAPILIIS